MTAALTHPHKNVVSSNVKSVGYDGPTHTLEVQFLEGGLYQYSGVPLSVYEAMMTAPSKGRFVHQNLKGRYDYKRAATRASASK